MPDVLAVQRALFAADVLRIAEATHIPESMLFEMLERHSWDVAALDAHIYAIQRKVYADITAKLEADLGDWCFKRRAVVTLHEGALMRVHTPMLLTSRGVIRTDVS